MASSASTTQLMEGLFGTQLRWARSVIRDRFTDFDVKAWIAERDVQREGRLAAERARDGLRAVVVERNKQRARLEREVNELRGVRDQLHAVLQILRDRADDPWVKAFAQMALNGELYDDPLALEEEAERAAKRRKDEDDQQVPLRDKERTITVPLDDLAKVLYLPKPTVTDKRRCATCGQSAGAHWCAPRQSARHRLEQQVEEALEDES